MRPRTGDGDNMKTRISALMDGELEDHEIADALRALRREGELRSHWSDAQLMGAALRGEQGLAIDVTARVMSALELEPTVMAPTNRRTDWRRPALSLAASAAGVAVVAWLGMGAFAPEPATGTVSVQAKVRPLPPQAQATPRIQEYLVAHQAYAPGGAITGGARNNIRTVAMAGTGR